VSDAGGELANGCETLGVLSVLAVGDVQQGGDAPLGVGYHADLDDDIPHMACAVLEAELVLIGGVGALGPGEVVAQHRLQVVGVGKLHPRHVALDLVAREAVELFEVRVTHGDHGVVAKCERGRPGIVEHAPVAGLGFPQSALGLSALGHIAEDVVHDSGAVNQLDDAGCDFHRHDASLGCQNLCLHGLSAVVMGPR